MSFLSSSALTSIKSAFMLQACSERCMRAYVMIDVISSIKLNFLAPGKEVS